MSEYRYLQIPVYLLREIYNNKFEAFDKMITCGIYRHSQNYYIDPDLCEAEYYNMQLHNFKEAAKFLRINVRDIETEFLKGRKIDNKGSGGAYAMVKLDLIFEYRDEDKTEFELMLFAANAALISILGEKEQCKTNKGHILARMFGYLSTRDIPEVLPKDIEYLYKKYQHRYHFDNLVNELKLNWFWAFYANFTRGMYFKRHKGINGLKTALKQLKTIAEANKRSYKLKQLKEIEKEVRLEAKEQEKEQPI